MGITELFAVLPYLKTSAPVDIRGIRFRSSRDREGLPDKAREHLTNLFSLFFLRADHRISAITYAHLDGPRGWLIEAQRSEVAEFITFANGLTADLQAVRAALEYAWSQGQVGGQVHRLKLVKR